MSSREISDLVNVRHDSARRTIERLAEKGVIQLPPLVEIATGARAAIEYVFSGEQGKRDSYVVVAQLSPEFTARLVDRWQELEAQALPPRASSRPPRLDVSREHRLMMKDQMMYAKLAGLDGNQMLLAANRATSLLTGIDNLGLLGITNMPAPQNEALLSPSDIADRLGMKSGQAVNKRLCELAVQTQHRDHKARVYYEPTEAGITAGATMVDTGKKHGNGTPVRQLRWSSAICRLLEKTAGQAH
jgi:DNA-binding Lrp family transcriptional regulator